MSNSKQNTILVDQNKSDGHLRKTEQFLPPVDICGEMPAQNKYNIYPTYKLDNGKIFNGYESLANWIIEQKTVVIDGYVGNFWDAICDGLNQYFVEKQLEVKWIETKSYQKPADVIDALVAPYLGTSNSVWGTKCLLSLNDLYEADKLRALKPNNNYDINIVIGCAAALAEWDAPIVYIDLPKNELQFRMRAGSVTNLGTDKLADNAAMYKRFYFVDWVLLNAHKKHILSKISIIADAQWLGDFNWMLMADLTDALNDMSRSVFRVRPWFEPGAWGGQWIRNEIEKINKDVVNYAWSFELIVPENGLMFESDGWLLEVSFDFIMFNNQLDILGKHAAQYGDEFPIRFDFLDTIDGGNLSIQCHPKLTYIKEVFGENITQDETYYILDCQDDATVYLGFQESIDPDEFRQVLEASQNNGIKVEIENYVQCHPAKKHDLFLIPNGTVHSAGRGNLVLEISATPYIFTFKMYDWLRLDLDGNPRPINIDHAFNNLDFERKGSKVCNELISKPVVIDEGAGWRIVHLPTHQEHFYDVHRLEFNKEIEVATNNSCHVLMLVEGVAIQIEAANGSKQIFAYAETFVLPAAAQSYKITNLGGREIKVIKAFLK